MEKYHDKMALQSRESSLRTLETEELVEKHGTTGSFGLCLRSTPSSLSLEFVFGYQVTKPRAIPFTTEELLNFSKQISDEEKIKSITSGSPSVGNGVGPSVGVCVAAIGSLFIGPYGLLLGGFVGGLSGYLIAKDKYKALSTILSEMSPKEKEKLRSHFEQFMRKIGVRDLITLATHAKLKTTIRAKIVTALIEFTEKELGIQIMN